MSPRDPTTPTDMDSPTTDMSEDLNLPIDGPTTQAKADGPGSQAPCVPWTSSSHEITLNGPLDADTDTNNYYLAGRLYDEAAHANTSSYTFIYEPTENPDSTREQSSAADKPQADDGNNTGEESNNTADDIATTDTIITTDTTATAEANRLPSPKCTCPVHLSGARVTHVRLGKLLIPKDFAQTKDSEANTPRTIPSYPFAPSHSVSTTVPSESGGPRRTSLLRLRRPGLSDGGSSFPYVISADRRLGGRLRWNLVGEDSGIGGGSFDDGECDGEEYR